MSRSVVGGLPAVYEESRPVIAEAPRQCVNPTSRIRGVGENQVLD